VLIVIKKLCFVLFDISWMHFSVFMLSVLGSWKVHILAESSYLYPGGLEVFSGEMGQRFVLNGSGCIKERLRLLFVSVLNREPSAIQRK
jgi:hypothetical protein